MNILTPKQPKTFLTPSWMVSYTLVKNLFLRESESEFGEKESSVSTALALVKDEAVVTIKTWQKTETALEKSLAPRVEHWIILPGLY